jgi:hypothetical protein
MKAYRLPEAMIEIFGKHGTLTVTDDFVRFTSDKDKSGATTQLLYKQSFDNSAPFLLADPEFTKEDQFFLDCVEKKSMPECNFIESAKVNRLIDQINESTW